ncbi:sugar phosphate permease [Saccharomonospora marina XMU15]|uniref:Sugar phosphate permease n=1 Tax=Saccharomonospora marina XMU15 TaxID=882083 RepID=H5X134_9PSEU|nr:MFS transporter [Saccharomonospora marina]EHR53093.1 sugar phosphate permease [Saccharomonospora marina XMU15]
MAEVVAHRRSAGGRRLAFALLACVQVTLIAAITVLTVALPAVQADLGVDDAGLVLASSAYGVAFGGLLLFGGRIADLVGHRRSLTAGMAAFALACLAAALAPGAWALIAARFGQGAGAALAAPAAMALLGPVFLDPARRARAVAFWGVLASVGATLGNVVAGVVLTWASWRWVFVLPAVVSVVVLVSAPRLIPAGSPPRRTSLDLPGAATVTAGLAVAIYGLGIGSIGWTVAGVGLLGAFALIEARSTSPLLPLSFLLAPSRAVALAAIAVTAAGMSAAHFILALYLQQVRGYSPAATSAMFLLPVVALLTAGPLVGRTRVRLGTQPLLVAGLLLAGAGCLLLTQVGHAWPGAAALQAALLAFSLGAGVSFSAAMVLATTDTPHGRAGVAAAVANTAMEVGPPVGLAVLIPLASSYAASQHHLPSAEATGKGYGFAFTLAAITFAVTAAVALAAHLKIGRRIGRKP